MSFLPQDQVGQLAQSLKGTLRNFADVVPVHVEELQPAHTLTCVIKFSVGPVGRGERMFWKGILLRLFNTAAEFYLIFSFISILSSKKPITYPERWRRPQSQLIFILEIPIEWSPWSIECGCIFFLFYQVISYWSCRHPRVGKGAYFVMWIEDVFRDGGGKLFLLLLMAAIQSSSPQSVC